MEEHEDKLMKVVSSLGYTVAYDSFKAKTLSIQGDKLIDLAIANSLYYFFVDDYVVAQFGKYMTKGKLGQLILETLGISAAMVGVKFAMGKEYDLKKIITNSAISSMIGEAFDAIKDKMI